VKKKKKKKKKKAIEMDFVVSVWMGLKRRKKRGNWRVAIGFTLQALRYEV